MSAAAISRTAFIVSSSGSPGPAPTSHTIPGAKSSCGMALLLGNDARERGAARTAMGAGAQCGPDRGDVGEALIADRGDDCRHPDIEADADERTPVGLRTRRASGEQRG